MKSSETFTFERYKLWLLNPNETTTARKTIKFHAFSYYKIGTASSQTENDSESFEGQVFL